MDDFKGQRIIRSKKTGKFYHFSAMGDYSYRIMEFSNGHFIVKNGVSRNPDAFKQLPDQFDVFDRAHWRTYQATPAELENWDEYFKDPVTWVKTHPERIIGPSNGIVDISDL
jgi:hypothetical protein